MNPSQKDFAMDMQIETIDDFTVVRLQGSFDRSARGELEIELLALVGYGSNLVFDLYLDIWIIHDCNLI